MSVTIKDIARMAGVSYSTVSKALKNSPLVNEQTKRKIKHLADEYGYQPNLIAQSLVSKKSGIIGIVWPTVEIIAISTLMTHITAEMERRSYSALLSVSSLESGVRLFNRLRVDGILVFELNRMFNPSESVRSAIPVLSFGLSNVASPYASIDVNRKGAIETAVRYLHGLGHRRIGFVGNLEDHFSKQHDKFLGYMDAMDRLGLPADPHLRVHTRKLVWQEGYRAAKFLLQCRDRPTAIVSASYELTVGIILAMKEAQIHIPSDMSIVSYDNVPQLAHLEIPVTAVGVPVEKMAACMAEAALRMVERPGDDSPPPMAEVELAERLSCAPPKPER